MLESLFKIKLQAGLQYYQKETPTQVFSCEIYEVFKNTYFEEHLRTTVSRALQVLIIMLTMYHDHQPFKI